MNTALIAQSLRRMAEGRAVFGRFDLTSVWAIVMAPLLLFTWVGGGPTFTDMLVTYLYLFALVWAVYTVFVSTTTMLGERLAREHHDGMRDIAQLAAGSGAGYLCWLTMPVVAAAWYRLLRAMALLFVPVLAGGLAPIDVLALFAMLSALLLAVVGLSLVELQFTTSKTYSSRALLSMMLGCLAFAALYSPFRSSGWQGPTMFLGTAQLLSPGILTQYALGVSFFLLLLAGAAFGVGYLRLQSSTTRRRRRHAPVKRTVDTAVFASAAFGGPQGRLNLRTATLLGAAGFFVLLAPTFAVIGAIIVAFRQSLLFIFESRRSGVWDDVILVNRSEDLVQPVAVAMFQRNWIAWVVISVSLIVGNSAADPFFIVFSAREVTEEVALVTGLWTAIALGAAAGAAAVYAAREIIKLVGMEAIHAAVKYKNVRQTQINGAMAWRPYVIYGAVMVFEAPLLGWRAVAESAAPQPWLDYAVITSTCVLMGFLCAYARERLRKRVGGQLEAFAMEDPATQDDLRMLTDPVYAMTALNQTAHPLRKKPAPPRERMTW